MTRTLLALSGLALLIAIAFAAHAAEPQRPATLGMLLTLVKVEENAIIVKTRPTQREASREVTLKTDKETKVSVGEIDSQEQTDEGGMRVSVKYRPGTLADLKPGHRILISVDEDLVTAIRIIPAPTLPPGKPPQKDQDQKPPAGK